MKKIIKPVIIILVIVALVVGGLYGIYTYRQGKKTADVASMEYYGMDGYWGDSIESYGEVTADKAQTAYLASGTEVLSVNVSEGDHVEAGDVLLTVRKESQNQRAKELEVQKAEQKLIAAKNKLERLQNTKPIPEYISTSEDTRTITYINSRTYSLKAGETFTVDGDDYAAGDTIYVVYYNSDNSESYREYYEPGAKYGLDDTKDSDKAKINKIKTALNNAGSGILDVTEDTSSEEITVGTFYYDAETGEIIGHEANYEGAVQYAPPTGYKPSELKTEIEAVTKEIEKADLDYRIKAYQLDLIKNTDDSGALVAKISGTVSKVQSADNYNSTQPFLIITATDEYYITGSVGEFYLDSVHVGDTVTIMSWDDGTTTDAVISSISDTPSESNSFYGGNGNTNSSNYEFKATFDKNSGIEIGSAVDISISPTDVEEDGLYIPSYFIRKDASGSYVMKMGDDNTLEKVYVKVGKSLWGSMTEVKSGITLSDYLAFPYGNGAIEGLNCNVVESFDY